MIRDAVTSYSDFENRGQPIRVAAYRSVGERRRGGSSGSMVSSRSEPACVPNRVGTTPLQASKAREPRAFM